MKKNSTLLFLLLNIICLAQKPSGVLDMNLKLEAMYYPKPSSNINKTTVLHHPEIKQVTTLQKTNAPILNATFYRLTGSHDMLGNLISHSKPLQYHRILQAFSFITRKSITYSPSSDGNEGTIVGFIGKNDANTNNLSSWDSTCLWTNTLNIAIKAQGALWVPGAFSFPNNNTSNAYFVASGSTKSGTTITGSYRASKQVGSFGTNTPGSDMQFFANTSPFSNTVSSQMTKHDEPDYSFQSSYGPIWNISMIYNDVNGIDDITRDIRGAHLSKGTFVSGGFVWQSDSITLLTEMKTNGTKALWRQPFMAFEPNGQVGYVMMIGVRIGAVPGNPHRGMQPIIYKTTNAGASWTLVNGIDFTQTAAPFPYLKNSIDPVSSNPTLTIPYFNPAEGIDITMDENNKLHILTTICGTAKEHIDSLNYIHQYTINGETYSSPHVNTKRPYILDFFGDGTTGWDCKIIDSLDTECPATYSSGPGFNYNPWANNSQSIAVSSGARLQLSKTYCGNHLIYSWAESDTNITTNACKWNEYPNIKMKSLRICDDKLSTDVLIPTGTFSTLIAVKDKAYFHYLSNYCKDYAINSISTSFILGLSVSNNSGYDALLPVSHFFSASNLQFTFPSGSCPGWPSYPPQLCWPSRVKENLSIQNNLEAYPNPASKELTLELTGYQTASFKYALTDLAGKLIYNGHFSNSSKTLLDIQKLDPGVYIITVKDGEKLIGVKKIVKE